MILRFLIGEETSVAPIESVDDCHARIAAFDARFASTVDRAAAGGFVADRIGYAFLAGYRAALSRLDPTLTRTSLCATESGGAHPRAIETRLAPLDDAFVLNGEKTFATLASAADVLLVVASRGKNGDRNQLQIARIPSKREGVSFRDVRVEASEILEGDGYTHFLKPFRTIEDVHVISAWLGHVVRLVRAYDEPRELGQKALAAIAALRTLGEEDPLDSATHIALAGVLAVAAELAAAVTLAKAEEAVRARWQRDLPLLAVAGMARNARLEAAYAYRPQRKGSLPR